MMYKVTVLFAGKHLSRAFVGFEAYTAMVLVYKVRDAVYIVFTELGFRLYFVANSSLSQVKTSTVHYLSSWQRWHCISRTAL